MKIKSFSILLLLIGLFFSGCKKGDDSVSPEENNTSGGKLIDKPIDPTKQDVTVTVPGKINVVIPQGVAPANTQVTIEQLETAAQPKDTKFDLLNVYEVKLSSGSTFTKPLKVTLNYDPAKAPKGKFRNKMGAAFYDETAKRWSVFPDCVVDTINYTITFSTLHLTKLAAWGWTALTSYYTDYYSTTHFNIYWQAGKVYSNTEYHTPLPTAGSSPDYIKDIGRYLELSYDTYKSLGLTVPTLVKVDVYLTSTLEAGTDGQESYLGYIYLREKIAGDGKLPPEQIVPMVCAHEFLHYVQDYYYMQSFAQYTIQWWLEASATQADRLVWPKNTNFESLFYIDKVPGLIYKSWDDCNADPDWYTAGCFLMYLSTYKDGNKANIAELIKQCGSTTAVSYIRTVIDNYLKSSLLSKGLGTEYSNYIKWAFEMKGPVKLNTIPPLQKGGDDLYVVPVFVPLVETTTNVKKTFPYLSVRSIKIYHDKNADPKVEQDKEITINAKDIPADVNAYIYSVNYAGGNTSVTYKQQLLTGGQVVYTIPKGGSEWIEILMINTSKDDSKTVDIDIKSKVPDDIFALLKKSNSVSSGVSGNHNVGNVGNTSIVAFYPPSSASKPYPLFTWNGTSFSASYTPVHQAGYSVERSQTISGTVSADGKTLTTYNVKDVINTYGTDNNLRYVETTEISLKNLPIVSGQIVGANVSYSFTGVNCPNYISKLTYTYVSITYNGTTPIYNNIKTYSSTNWASDSKVSVSFSTQ